ncbi:hypothetical protein CLOM_g12122 [Closterium sp. NIES-68]|nr:hypothetical protein CLOM_g12122 [Closterium sp. NIES-68]GJP61052.1 hypothetical protein CLOP_g18260 [Closterium sp. NIES-67]
MRSRGVPVSLWTKLTWPNHALIPRSTIALAVVSLFLTCIALSASLLASTFIRSAPPPVSARKNQAMIARHATAPDVQRHGAKSSPRGAEGFSRGSVIGQVEGGRGVSGPDVKTDVSDPNVTSLHETPGMAILGGLDGSGVGIVSGAANLKTSGAVEKIPFTWYEWVLGALSSPLVAFSNLNAPYPAKWNIEQSGHGNSAARKEGREMSAVDGAHGSGYVGVLGEEPEAQEEAALENGDGKAEEGKAEQRKVEQGNAEQGEVDEDGEEQGETKLWHVMFNIASSRATFPHRRTYLRSWWRSGGGVRGYVWVDDVAAVPHDVAADPPLKASSGTSHLSYRGTGLREYLRLARIVIDAYRLGEKGVRWYVMGDDDTYFSPHALAAFLQQYDHRTPLYLGAPSETHYQNVAISHGMAFGGGGFAISAALARMLSDNGAMDACLERHAALWGSDERVANCAGELGVSLTPTTGFHQIDLGGSLFGLLMAHPLRPLLSLHHLDFVDPLLLPAGVADRAEGLATLAERIRPDPVGFAQLAVCGDGAHWTAAISWGFAIKIYPGARLLSDLVRAERTFYSFVGSADPTAFTFDTRLPEDDAPPHELCSLPFTMYASHVGQIVTNTSSPTEVQRLNMGSPKESNAGVVSVYNRTSFLRRLDRSHCPLSISKVMSARIIRPHGPMRMGNVHKFLGWSGPNLRRQRCARVELDGDKKMDGLTLTVWLEDV